MMRMTACVLLFLIGTGAAVCDTTYYYESETGDKVIRNRIVLSESSEGFQVHAFNENNELTYEALLDRDLRTLRYIVNVREPDQQIECTANFDYPDLTVAGTSTGKYIKKYARLDTRELRHYFSFQLKPFVTSSKSYTRFYSILPDTFDIYEFEARKEKIETLRFAGVDVKTVRVRVNLTGFLSLFYSTTLWYRASDGILLRQDDRDGKGNNITLRYVKQE